MKLSFVDRLKDPRERGTTLVLLLLIVLWVAWTLPLALGERTLLLRDVLRTHAPYKAFGAKALGEGLIPAINPTWGLGQPFAGNPSAVAFYPGNLLYLALPFWSAFNLHFALHWVLGFLGMRALARSLGQSAAAALLAATAWAGSGVFLSLLTFYNLVGVAAWAPWILLGLVRGGRGGVALAGLATGLALLAGEPLSAALFVPAMLLAAWEGRSLRRALGLSLASGALGLLVALPQLVATARVVGFSYRAALGVTTTQATAQSLSSLRLLELVLPLPWGWPADRQQFEFWSMVATPRMPYFFSLHFGVVALALALAAVSIRRRWAALAAGALLIAWAGGLSGEVNNALTRGVFRFPQKTLLLFTLACALLSGWGLDRWLRAEASPRPRSLRIAWGGTALVALAVGLLLARAPAARALDALARARDPQDATRAMAVWAIGFGFAGLVLIAAAWALLRRRPALVVLAQAIGLAALAPALATGSTADYRGLPRLAEPIERRAGDRPAAIVPVTYFITSWEPLADASIEQVDISGAPRVGYQALEPLYAIAHEASYPLLPDVEGLVSPLTVLIVNNLAPSSWASRLEWMRRSGVEWVVRLSSASVEGLERVGVARVEGLELGLDRVLRPLPFVRWPAAIESAWSPLEAYSRIAGGKVAEDSAVASRAVEHRPGATVRLLRESPDDLLIDVEGEGGLLVVQRAWLPIYRARLADGTRLRTQPVDVALLGVEVPAGRQRVEISISSAPEKIAGVIALLVAGALLVILFRSSKPRAVGAVA